MRAIDTNIVVRFLTADDLMQAETARSIIAAGDVFVSLTVCLEVAWVLRSSYEYASDDVELALASLGRTAGVHIENREALTKALAWLRQGMDFADALHLAQARGCESFLSFDRKLAKIAGALSDVPVVVP